MFTFDALLSDFRSNRHEENISLFLTHESCDTKIICQQFVSKLIRENIKIFIIAERDIFFGVLLRGVFKLMMQFIDHMTMSSESAKCAAARKCKF